MNNKWAILGLAATLGLAAGCNKGDTSTNPSTDSSQQGASQSAEAQKPAPEPPRPIVVPAENPDHRGFDEHHQFQSGQAGRRI